MKNRVQLKRARGTCGSIIFSVLAMILGCGQNPAPQTSPPVETHSAASTENQKIERYDLEQDENRGGHTLARHIGRTDEQLAERLRKERNISAASTWSDRATAEKTVRAALEAARERIDNWMRRGERRPNLALHYDAGYVIGRSLRRDASASIPCTSAVIVLRAYRPEHFYILTSYPEAANDSSGGKL